MNKRLRDLPRYEVRACPVNGSADGAAVFDRGRDERFCLIDPVDACDSGQSALARAKDIAAAFNGTNPIPMLLFCPRCGEQHVDEPELGGEWTNPPHRSHLCQGCGCIWRPADIPTTGVATIRTIGKADTWAPAPDQEKAA